MIPAQAAFGALTFGLTGLILSGTRLAALGIFCGLVCGWLVGIWSYG